MRSVFLWACLTLDAQICIKLILEKKSKVDFKINWDIHGHKPPFDLLSKIFVYSYYAACSQCTCAESRKYIGAGRSNLQGKCRKVCVMPQGFRKRLVVRPSATWTHSQTHSQTNTPYLHLSLSHTHHPGAVITIFIVIAPIFLWVFSSSPPSSTLAWWSSVPPSTLSWTPGSPSHVHYFCYLPSSSALASSPCHVTKIADIPFHLLS